MLAVVRWLSICVLASCGFSGASGGDGAPSDAMPDGQNMSTADAPVSMLDGQTTVDAPTDSPACQACALAGGACDGGGVCVFDCDAESCEDRVECPPGIACSVTCEGEIGDSACPNGVDCGDATACEVTCTVNACGGDIVCSDADSCSISCAAASCTGNLICGSGPCKVSCVGASCSGNIDCDESCACAVGCFGGSCASEPSCPSTTCDTGRGCTDFGPCNQCN